MSAILESEIADRVRVCELKGRAYSIWLSALRPANLIFVVGAGLFSLIAGASVLIQNSVITAFEAGILALISSALTLIHYLLGCDPHQAECRRLKHLFDGLRVEYSGLRVLGNETEGRKRLAAIDAELAAILKGAAADPARWCMARAQRELKPH